MLRKHPCPLLLLFTAFLFYHNTCHSQQKSRQVIDIEHVFQALETEFVRPADTLRLNALTDSIAKEGNTEKTEYAQLFAFLQKKKLFRNDSLKWYVERSASLFAAFKTPGAKATWKFKYGEHLFNDQKYSEAMELMLEAVSEFKSIGYENIPEVSIIFDLLSVRYYDFKNYRQSIYYAELANKYRVGNHTNGAINTIGLAYQKAGIYDSAILRFKETMAAARADTFGWYSIASGNLGRTYCLQQNYAAGIPYLLFDVEHGAKSEPLNAALSALYVVDAYNHQSKTDSSFYYLQKAKQMVVNAGWWGNDRFYHHKFCYYYYEQKAELNQLLGNYPEAYNNQDTAHANKEKFDSQYDWQLLTSAEKRIEGMEYQQDINLLASEKKNQQLQNIILAILLGMVVSIVLLLQYSQRIKRKKEKQLTIEKETNLLLKKEAAEQQLEHAQQQLNELLIQFQQKTDLQEHLQEDMAEFSKSESHVLTKEQSTKILNELASASLLTNRDWQLFQQRFEKVYTNFFSTLVREVPGITPAEERMLALLKLKVPARQMANMLGISPESVRTSKYRLRKKLVASNQEELMEQLEE